MESHKEKMLRKKRQRDTEWLNTQLVRAKVAEAFNEDGVKERLLTTTHRQVYKNIEMASFLLQLGRNPQWVKRLLGLNRATMNMVYELNTTTK